MADQCVEWMLSHGERRLTCVVHGADSGPARDAVVYYDGLPVRTRTCASDADFAQWSSSVHAEWIACGWVPADKTR